MIVIYGAYVWNDNFSRYFFHFFETLILRIVSGVKGQKLTQNDKRFCPSRSISQEPYIIWLPFMVLMCKMIISPGVFFNFSKFWFSGSSRWWKGKKWSKMTKHFVCRILCFRNHTSNDLYLWYTCVKG